ncbi:flavin reductase family protein [Frigidibacter sp. ROC022]|uniref:flavin reductase family protein n=1 Tax=Frigidibacter sp. ROC022 TaxID=2971796 RepID=UPI00215B5BBF|nr:flavin reductase family protein [Frigidibacter sp. ROC022]MCR8726627.1 flavin reductase family protein [Frigidibacter sp. ROC022]
MFYEPKDGHGLPHNPFNAIVTPRPIGWISSRGAGGGDNLAPYSFFNAVAYVPPQVMFSSTGSKDSLGNIRETGVFCVNVVEAGMAEAMNLTSRALPPGGDEFDLAGLPREDCRLIPCSRVAGAPAALECRLIRIEPLLGRDNHMVLGEVIGIHLRDDCLKDGRFDVLAFRPVARLGYRDFTVVDSLRQMARPDD